MMNPNNPAFVSHFVATEPSAEDRHVSSAYGTTASPFLDQAIQTACARIAPLWPLKNFVAVNPFMGLSDQTYRETCESVRRIAHGELLMPARFYLDQLATGRITEADLQHALDLHDQDPHSHAALPAELPQLIQALEQLDGASPVSEPGRCHTVADALDPAGRWARLTTDEISKWCAAQFDEGQASWQSPWRSVKPYLAWRRSAQFDRSPELSGFRRFREHIGSLPFEPVAAIARTVTVLGIPQHAWVDFLQRSLMSVHGWSSYLQYRVRECDRFGHHEDLLVQLLAIRLSYDYALFREFGNGLPRNFCEAERFTRTAEETGTAVPMSQDLDIRHLAQQAYEHAFHRRLIGRLKAAPDRQGRSETTAQPADLAAVFCIDVRSEIFRRALENQSPTIRTHGFAGFFGVPVEYVPLGHNHGPALCPVLIKPTIRLRESIAGAAPRELGQILARRMARKRASAMWKAFKSSAVSCFAYVETFGLLFAPKLISDMLGLTRPVTSPAFDGLDRNVIGRLYPALTAGSPAHSEPLKEPAFGIRHEQRLDLARNALRGMGLNGKLPRLVLLCGHGSTTVNNPYAAGLNCGACGGHSGEANARIAAAILNDPKVRAALACEDWDLTADTWFIAAMHDTTTDDVVLFDTQRVPKSHREDLARTRLWLDAASAQARCQRAPRLGIAPLQQDRVDHRVRARSRDWSQVRPEWGLAGNAAFIAAPRHRTQGLDLGGRAFLHDYDATADSDGSLLELIMTAPMIVASWINLQYFASTVDPERFGSGNKTLHNVVGTIGVLEGNAGDLRVGLPIQSVHDGKSFVHEPLRLAVLIEAAPSAIDRVLGRHADVRRLVENGWIHLFAIVDDGQRYLRYRGEAVSRKADKSAVIVDRNEPDSAGVGATWERTDRPV